MKKYIFIAIPIIVAVVVSVFAAIWYIDNRSANFTQEHVLYVYPDMTSEQVLESLDSVTVRPRSLARMFEKENVASKIKPGRYVIDPSSSSVYVARMLNFGWQTPHNLTLSGTMRSKGVIARKIALQMMVDSASVAQALDSTEFLSAYGFTPENVFALILPDTYQMYWTASVKEIFDRFKKEYDAFWTADRKAKAAAQKLSPMQVSIMASIVSGETLKPFEYPVIAGVYLNRYRKGMKLQADPTVCFCWDYKLDRVLKKHLTIDSPIIHISMSACRQLLSTCLLRRVLMQSSIRTGTATYISVQVLSSTAHIVLRFHTAIISRTPEPSSVHSQPVAKLLAPNPLLHNELRKGDSPPQGNRLLVLRWPSAG